VWESGEVELVSVTAAGGVGNGRSSGASLDDSGNLVGFSSNAHELTNNSWSQQGLVRDRALRQTEHASASITGERGHSIDGVEAISGDGRTIVLLASSSNLIPDDPGSIDILTKSFPFPRVARVAPATLAPGTTTTVAIGGHSFAGPIAVEIDENAGAPLIIGTPVRVSASQIQVSITVPAGATAQAHDVTVKNVSAIPGDGGTQTTCYSCLTIT
jgi:hypothetical protein